MARTITQKNKDKSKDTVGGRKKRKKTLAQRTQLYNTLELKRLQNQKSVTPKRRATRKRPTPKQSTQRRKYHRRRKRNSQIESLITPLLSKTWKPGVTSTPMRNQQLGCDVFEAASPIDLFPLNVPNESNVSKTIVLSDEESVIEVTDTNMTSKTQNQCTIDLIHEDYTMPNTNDDVLVIEPPIVSIIDDDIVEVIRQLPKRRKKPEISVVYDKGVDKQITNNAVSEIVCGISNLNRDKSPATPAPQLESVGGNIYTDVPLTLPKQGLRPVIIDGSNVAFSHSHNKYFSTKGLHICIKYFKEKGHKVTAFVPQFRVKRGKCDDPKALDKLAMSGDVVLTPSREVDGRNIVPYDDRYIVQAAVVKGGVIITRDNYRDLLTENPHWAHTIKYKLLFYTWVDDLLMFPNDPLGKGGPTLDEFLRFS